MKKQLVDASKGINEYLYVAGEIPTARGT